MHVNIKRMSVIKFLTGYVSEIYCHAYFQNPTQSVTYPSDVHTSATPIEKLHTGLWWYVHIQIHNNRLFQEFLEGGEYRHVDMTP